MNKDHNKLRQRACVYMSLTFSDLQGRKTEIEAELHSAELPHVATHVWSR